MPIVLAFAKAALIDFGQIAVLGKAQLRSQICLHLCPNYNRSVCAACLW